jgi:hypothetical protein
MSTTTLEPKKAQTKSQTPNLDLSTVTPPDTSAIIDYLRGQAATVLGSALGGLPLVNFAVGAAGNFPYYYSDPATLSFNSATYNWININLLNNLPPVQQSTGNSFTNEMIAVLSKVTYKLSAADQITLNNAYSNAQNQQLSLLQAWQAAFGSFPAGAGRPIDNIMSTIASTWASPATTFNAIQNSINLNQLLNNAPPTGQGLFPLVANYVNALGSGVTLANAVTMNNAYVRLALNALQNPAAANGAIQTNDGTQKFYPAYNMNTPLTSIINSLQNKSSTIQITMDVSIASESEYSVSIQGGTSFRIPFLDFFSLGVSGNASYFHDEMVKNSDSVSITMTFTGPTIVNYAPLTFNQSTQQGWFFMAPILEAIKNQGQDVSGYQFAPSPGIDFSNNGPFGLLQGVAIANYPSAKIVIKSSSYQSIQTTFQQTVSVGISFLGIPLGSSTESTYSHSASSSSTDSTVTITLNPPPNMVAGTSISSMGWILGAQTNYPAAG